MWFLLYLLILIISWVQIKSLLRDASKKKDLFLYVTLIGISLSILILSQVGISIPSPLEGISLVYDPVHRFFK